MSVLLGTWIVAEAQRRLTPNRYRAPEVNPVELLVLHYTAGYSAASSVSWFLKPEAKASAHFVIERDGVVTQMAPLEDRTWHAGGGSSRWRGKAVNSRSIGIEIANLGPLKADGRGGWIDVYGRAWRGTPFLDTSGRAWEPYPEAQIVAVLGLVAELKRRFPVLALHDESQGQLPRICGHQDVDPKRKIDPGPAWPWSRLRSLP